MTEKIDELSSRAKEGGVEAAELAAAAAMTSKVVKVLVGIIDELGTRGKQGLTADEQKKQVLRQAGEALGKALGPVDEYFERNLSKHGSPTPFRVGVFYRLLPLRADIQDFSASVMEVLLGSDTLQLRSENDTHYLLCAWLSQSSRLDREKGQKDKTEEEQEEGEEEQEDEEEEKAVAAEEEGGEVEESADDDSEDEDEEEERDKDRAILKQLLPQLRFHHMSHDFLCMVVSACPFASALPYIMSCGHALRTMPGASAIRTDVKRSKVDRSTGNMKCIFWNEIDLAELMSLEDLFPGPTLTAHKYLGLAAGFPVAVQLKHESQGTVGMFTHIGMPPWLGFNIPGGVGRGVCFEYSLALKGRRGKVCESHFTRESRSRGRTDSFGKPWKEVICPNSPKFPDGVIAFELTLKPITQS